MQIHNLNTFAMHDYYKKTHPGNRPVLYPFMYYEVIMRCCCYPAILSRSIVSHLFCLEANLTTAHFNTLIPYHHNLVMESSS